MLPNYSTEDLKGKLELFNKRTENEMNAIINGTKFQASKQEAQETNELKAQLRLVLDDIAKNGDTNRFDWKLIRNIVILKIKDILISMQSSFPDCKTVPGESFDEQMEIILQFMCGFEEKPPFTIQRICELILEPKKYYKSSKKLLFAFEKVKKISGV